MKSILRGLLLLAWSGGALALQPCQVLTEADVRAALGGQWKVWKDTSGEEVCVFQSSPAALVTLTLFDDPMGAEQILASRRQLAGDKAKSAPGPGAGAFRMSTPNADMIVFGKGTAVGQIDVTHAATKDPAVLDRLAKAAYDRMP